VVVASIDDGIDLAVAGFAIQIMQLAFVPVAQQALSPHMPVMSENHHLRPLLAHAQAWARSARFPRN
jgi:hypothetical protein